MSELVAFLDSEEGLQIKEMDKAIEKGECTDISQEIQDILQELFAMGRKRAGTEPKESEQKLEEVAVVEKRDALPTVTPEEPVVVERTVAVPAAEKPTVEELVNARPANVEQAVKKSDSLVADNIEVDAAKDSEPEITIADLLVSNKLAIDKDKTHHSHEDSLSTSAKDLTANKKGKSLKDLFTIKKDKSMNSLAAKADGSKTSTNNIFQSFDSKTAKVKTERQLMSGSFGDAWKGTCKGRDVVVKTLFRDNGRYHAPVLRLFAEEASKISTMKHERFVHCKCLTI
jgi:hypothetical protein